MFSQSKNTRRTVNFKNHCNIMSMPLVYALCLCLHSAFPRCMFKLLVHAVCSCCFFMLLVHYACPCCTFILHAKAVCPCFMSMPHVHVLCRISILIIHGACPCCMSKLLHMSPRCRSMLQFPHYISMLHSVLQKRVL